MQRNDTDSGYDLQLDGWPPAGRNASGCFATALYVEPHRTYTDEEEKELHRKQERQHEIYAIS